MRARLIRCRRCGEAVAGAPSPFKRVRWVPTNCAHVQVGVAGDALTVAELRRLAEAEVER